MARTRFLRRPALRVFQDPAHPLFMLTLTAEELMQIAEISRIGRGENGELRGYQRLEQRRHVRNITDYLNGEHALFPNSLILALSKRVRFRPSSRNRAGGDGLSQYGTLEIPFPSNGDGKPAWIVDGQQRALALSRSRRKDYPVPINAFVALDESVQREHFLRVNSTKPLPRGLITELLPELTMELPAVLGTRKVPAALCDMLSRDPESPFRGLIRRASMTAVESKAATVTDTALVRMLQDSLNSPNGCLFSFRNLATGESDPDGMRAVLLIYWNAVRNVFPNAWGLSPTRSRLMHGAGIRAMGKLMDRVMGGVDPFDRRSPARVRHEIQLIAGTCHWTGGRWEELGLFWNEIQNVPSHIRNLSNFLVTRYLALSSATS